MAADKEELGWLDQKLLDRVEPIVDRLLAKWGVSREWMQAFFTKGVHVLADAKAVVYGGTVSDGTHTRGWIKIEAGLEQRLENIEACLLQLVQQEGPRHAAAALHDEAPVPGHASTDQDQADEDHDAEGSE